MKRRNFLGSLAALAVTPAIAKDLAKNMPLPVGTDINSLTTVSGELVTSGSVKVKGAQIWLGDLSGEGFFLVDEDGSITSDIIEQ